MRVADYICEYLEELGVTHVFMLSGGGMMHLQDALSRREKLKYVCCHHEQSAAYAAESYSRISGKLGCVFATSGPGGANAVTGVLQAWIDSSPLLVITGQAKLSETIRESGIIGLRQYGTFECDIVSIVKPITKFAEVLMSPVDTETVLTVAVHKALRGRPGPVLIDIPVDIQGAQFAKENECYAV